MQIMEDIKQASKGAALTAGKNLVRLKMAQKQITIAGYETDFCDSPHETVRKMASIPYGLIVVDEDLIQEDKRVLIYMVGIPMQLRRTALYMLTGAGFKSMDTFSAFIAGVDGLINYQDLNRLAWYIQLLEKERHRLYREFTKIL
jgi:hypothetical protein